MPISYEVSEDGRFVHTRAVGEVTEQELLSYVSEFNSDRRIQPAFRELIDAAGVRAAGVSDETVEKIIELNRSSALKLEGSKCAIVLHREQEFGLAKLFEKLYKGPQRFIVFYNIEVAEKWLGWQGRLQ